MHIKVEFAFEVVRPKLSKVRFVPDNVVCLADTMETRPARKKGVEDGGYVLEVLGDELALVTGYVRIYDCNKRNQEEAAGVKDVLQM